MCPTQEDYDRLVLGNIGRVFSLNDAIDFMIMLDQFPTGQNTLGWANAKTGAPVAIGYNIGRSKPKKKDDKKTKNDKVKYYDSRTGKPIYKR